MPKPLPITEFADQLKTLVDELFAANVHFHIASGLRSSSEKYFAEIEKAPVFWRWTIRAHETAALLSLCRVYEDQKGALTLGRFLKTVEANPGVFQEAEFRKRISGNQHVDALAKHFARVDSKQLQTDLRFCANDLAVRSLLLWRGNVIAHLNYDLAIGKRRALSESNPLPFTDIARLIDKGFGILNRYSGNYMATAYSDRFVSRQDQDYLEVLRALRANKV